MINYSVIAYIQQSSQQMRLKNETPKIVKIKNITYSTGSSFTHWFVENFVSGIGTGKTDMEQKKVKD